MKSCKNLKGGLQEVADQLELERIGPQHQAGSDSLLTGAAFFKMREMFFEDKIDDAKYCGHLYGLGTSFVVNGNSVSSTVVNSNNSNTTANNNSSSTPTTVSANNNSVGITDNGHSSDSPSTT
ncbi:CCR4-NOT transcription complex subunit 7 [Armadillidium vulgare]|nr:CCR4-NOT transcription complex subunit 7 [Armadillidium vulgare]